MKRFVQADRKQPMLLPPDLREWVPEDDLAHFVIEAVERVDMSAIPREKTPVLDKPRGPKTEMRMSPEQVSAVVEPAGFTLADRVEFPPYHYGVVFRLWAKK